MARTSTATKPTTDPAQPAPTTGPATDQPDPAALFAGRTILGVPLAEQDDATAYATFTLAEDGRLLAAVAFKSAQAMGRTSIKKWETDHGVARGTVQMLSHIGGVFLKVGPALTIGQARDVQKVYGATAGRGSVKSFWQAMGLDDVPAYDALGLPEVPAKRLVDAIGPASKAVTAARAAATAAARPNDGTGSDDAAQARRSNVSRWQAIAHEAGLAFKRVEQDAEDGEREAYLAALTAVQAYGRGRGWTGPAKAPAKATPAKATPARRTA